MTDSAGLKRLKRRVRYANARGANIVLPPSLTRADVSRANIQVLNAKRARSRLRYETKIKSTAAFYNEQRTNWREQVAFEGFENLTRPQLRTLQGALRKAIKAPNAKERKAIFQKAADKLGIAKIRHPLQKRPGVNSPGYFAAALNEKRRKKLKMPTRRQEKAFNTFWEYAVKSGNIWLLDELAKGGVEYTERLLWLGHTPGDVFGDSDPMRPIDATELAEMTRAEAELPEDILEWGYWEKRKFRASKKKKARGWKNYLKYNPHIAEEPELGLLSNAETKRQIRGLVKSGHAGFRNVAKYHLK